MITGKRLFRLLICFVVCASLLASCGNDVSNDALAKLEALGDGDNRSFDEYRIIISASCGERVAASARELSDAISERTGSSCITVFDSNVSIASDDCFTVLLGNTAFDSTKTAFYGLRRDDYVCRVYENTMILGGKSDSATAAATEKYIDEILPMCEPTEIICDGGEFEYHCDYETDELMLCGFELDRYVFVCGNDRASYNLTRSLREIIADKCGYYPDILCENTVSGRREISVGISNSVSSLAKIEYDGEDVNLASDSIYGLSVVAEKLYGIIFDGAAEGEANVDITCEMSYTYSPSRLELLNVAADIAPDTDGVDKAIKLARLINESDSAIITAGAFHVDIWKLIENNLANKYYVIAQTLSDGRVLPLLVDTTVCSVESESVAETTALISRELIITHLDSGQRFVVLYYFGMDGTDCTETVKNRLMTSDDACIAVFMSSMQSGSFDIMGDGISVEYNSMLSVGSLKYRCGIFSASELLDCSEVSLNIAPISDSCFMAMSTEKRYCDAFCGLIGSEYIYN